MIKNPHPLLRRALSLAAALGLVVAVTGSASAATEPRSNAVTISQTTQATMVGQSISKQMQLAAGSPTASLFKIKGVASIDVTCTADQSNTGAIRNGLDVVMRNTGKAPLPLVVSRASERPDFIQTSGSTVTPGGARTVIFLLDDGLDNAHRLQVDTVANRRMALDLTALTKHTPTGGCLVNATLTTS